MVVDCSVTMPWLLKNDKTGYAVKVLQSLGTTIALVPRLWFLEVANVLLVFERRKRITQAESGRFAELLTQLPFDVDDSVYNRVFDGVISLAREQMLSLYDAVYLELAMRRGMPLATLDKGLVKAAKAVGVEIVKFR
jgi:predicted nucleic acid-binding protein